MKTLTVVVLLSFVPATIAITRQHTNQFGIWVANVAVVLFSYFIYYCILFGGHPEIAPALIAGVLAWSSTLIWALIDEKPEEIMEVLDTSNPPHFKAEK